MVTTPVITNTGGERPVSVGLRGERAATGDGRIRTASFPKRETTLRDNPRISTENGVNDELISTRAHGKEQTPRLSVKILPQTFQEFHQPLPESCSKPLPQFRLTVKMPKVGCYR